MWFKVPCISWGIWSSGEGDVWDKAASLSFMMFLLVPKICDSGSMDDWRVFDFKSLKHFWSNILVGYITALFFVSKGSSLDLYLRLLIDGKAGVS